MIDFFIALFGGSILGARLLGEGISNKAHNISLNYKHKVNMEILSEVELTAEERIEIDNYVGSGRYAEEVYAEIEDNLIQVFGEDYKYKFILPGSKYHIDNPKEMSLIDKKRKFLPHDIDHISGSSATMWALDLVLSKRGKVDAARYICGYELGDQFHWENSVLLCKEISKNLMKYNENLELVLSPKPGADDSKSLAFRKMVFKHQIW